MHTTSIVGKDGAIDTHDWPSRKNFPEEIQGNLICRSA